MSGFGIRALKKVVSDEHAGNKDQYIKHIVYGENTYAVLAFLRLSKKFPGEVKFISKNSFFKKDMLQEWACNINSVRSEEVAEALMSLTSRFEIIPKNENVLFYKDTKFHKFGGRAKSHLLREEENFFTNPSSQVNLSSMFTEEEFESMDEILEKEQLVKIISQIEVLTPDDLVEKSYFKLHTGENESIRCEKLYFCESPKKFLALVENKNQLDDSVYSFAAGISNEQAISLHLKYGQEVGKEAGTYILPQSMTHEWGSFIVDVSAYDPETQEQELTCLTFISENDVQEEDLARKIKLLKRVIERVFPELAKIDNYAQEIKFSDEYLQSGTNDTQYEELKEQHVRFLGQAAPIKHEAAAKFQYYSRGIYAIMSELQ